MQNRCEIKSFLIKLLQTKMFGTVQHTTY